jgi:hypothetical protein
MLATNSDSCPDVSVGAKLVVGVGEGGGAAEVAVGNTGTIVAIGVLSSTVGVDVIIGVTSSSEEGVVHEIISNTNTTAILQHLQAREW